MFDEKSEEVKKLAEQNTALIALLEKVQRTLKAYKGQDNFNGQLFKLVDLELFKARILNPLPDVPATRMAVGLEISVVQKVEPAGARDAATSIQPAPEFRAGFDNVRRVENR